MDNISKLKFCYGCGTCVTACPKKIIRLQEDRFGFFSPEVFDQDKCIECGLCLKVCSFCNPLSPEKKDSHDISSYAGWSKDKDVRKKCSTGGVVFEIANHMMQQGYKACGVRYNNELHIAEHFIANTIEEFKPSIGSKYLQSYTSEAFSQFKADSKYVVVGTPCQIASLREYIKLRRIENNFLLIDFFCHGVPSMNMWRKYLKYVSKRSKISPYEIAWRNKENGWHDSWVMSFKEKDSKEYDYLSNVKNGDLFYKMFLYNRCLNKACYTSCKFKMANSSADIRVGDLWGKHYSDEDAGVNGILAFTAKGKEALTSTESIQLVSESMDIVLEGQMKKGPKRDYIVALDSFLLRTPLSLPAICKINRLVPMILWPIFAIRGRLKQLIK